MSEDKLCPETAGIGTEIPPEDCVISDPEFIEKENQAPPGPTECPCTCEDFVKHIEGCRINDEQRCDGSDWKVWKRDIIFKAVKESLATLINFRPDIFAEYKEMALERGRCIHIFCEDCIRIVDVTSVDGRDCNRIKEYDDDGDDKDSLDFLECLYPDCKPPKCDITDEGAYDPGWWALEEYSPCTVRFENPTPKDRDVKALVQCVDPCILDCKKPLPPIVCAEFFQIIVDNALFRLYAIDHKDATHIELAQIHYKAWMDAIMMKFNVDYSFFEDDYLLTRRRINGDRG